MGRLFGDAFAGLARLELVGLVEDGADDLEVLGLGEPEERDVVDLGYAGGEVGVDHEAVHVAYDEQRRVLEGLGVLEELGVGGVEVLVLALVFPAEEALLPDVGPAVGAVGLGGAAFEGEPLALGVGLRRLGMLDQFAQVAEVLLRAGALRELRLPPLAHEFRRVHARPHSPQVHVQDSRKAKESQG